MGDDDAVRVGEYCALLRDNPRFRCLFGGYLVSNCGNWINYVAALAFIRLLLGEGASGGDSASGSSPGPSAAALARCKNRRMCDATLKSRTLT